MKSGSLSTVFLEELYYQPGGYYHEPAQLLEAARRKGHNFTLETVSQWLSHKAMWQIYRPRPRHIRHAHFDEPVPNRAHQADVLFLPHDRVGRKTYKYALTIVDVTNRYKAVVPLTDKSAGQVAQAFSSVYEDPEKPLQWPELLQVDEGKKLRGETAGIMRKHGVAVRRGEVGHHRAQTIVESWNRTLAERLFPHQYAQEMSARMGERSTV